MGGSSIIVNGMGSNNIIRLTCASSDLSDFSDSLLSSIISGVGSTIIVNGLGSSTLVRLVTGFLSVVTNIYLNLNILVFSRYLYLVIRFKLLCCTRIGQQYPCQTRHGFPQR